MAANSEPDAAAPGSSASPPWSLMSLIRAHRRASAGAIVFVLLVVAVTIVTTVSSPTRAPLSDSASCSQWAAATPAQKIAYSHVYINEYGAFANTNRNADAVEAAIDKSCVRAAYLGEADDISVLASLRHAF
jgi:hypothetical protein